MPVDKFGRMSDTKTMDTGVSLTYINNNYIRSDGSTPVTGSINMNGNTLYNVSEPIKSQDVATKDYADYIKASTQDYVDYLVKQWTSDLDEKVYGLIDSFLINYIRSDGTTPVSGSINMNGNTLYNVPEPTKSQDVATKDYADYVKASTQDYVEHIVKQWTSDLEKKVYVLVDRFLGVANYP